MPYVRALDGGPSPVVPLAELPSSILLGVALGAVGVWSCALSAVFVAGPLEIVLHLGVTSIVVWMARGRRRVGIVAAAAALVGNNCGERRFGFHPTLV